MAATVKVLKVPSETGELLQQWADKLGLTISATIRQLLADKIAAGELEDRLPGWTIKKVQQRPARYELSFDKFSFWLGQKDAANFADLLDMLAVTKGGNGSRLFDPATGKSLGVVRHGRGLVIVGTDERGRDTKHSLSPPLAQDLARLLRTSTQTVH